MKPSLLVFIIISITLISLSNSLCIINGTTPAILDNPAVICIHVFIDNTFGESFAFKTTVDHFQALKINGLSKYIKDTLTTTTNKTVTLKFQYQNTDDTKMASILLYDSTNLTNSARYREVSSIVIQIKDGLFQSIVVDNQNCDACGSNQVCYQGGCFIIGNNNGTNSVFPEARTFLSWIGTDEKGNYCISHTRRLSRFSQFSVGSIYNQAKAAVSG